MATLTTYAANHLNDHVRGLAAFTMPAPWCALIQATAGQSPRSAAVAVGKTTIPATPNGHMYRCTATTGNTGSTEPTWPITSTGATVVDGGVTWTEMTPDFQANNTFVTSNEASYTGYARIALAGTQGASSGGSGANSTLMGFAPCTGAISQFIGASMTYDASSVGNGLTFGAVALAVSPGITPQFAIGAFVTAAS